MKALSFVLVSGFFIIQNPALAQTTPTAANSGAGQNSSYNWAGYVAAGQNYTSVSGSWNIPQIPAASGLAADAAWVGIGGVNSSDLIQAGTQAITSGSSTTYQAWYEILPAVSQNISMTINPGDSITASITQSGTNQWTINLRDNTNNQSFQTNIAYNSSQNSAEWIEEMPSQGNGGFIPLDNFGTVQFSGASAVENGQSVNLSQANAQPMTMLNLGGQVLAQPAAINSDGASFSVSRSSAQAASPISGFPGFTRRGWKRNGSGIQGYRGRTGQSQPGQGTTTIITIPSMPGIQQQQLNMLRRQMRLFSQFSNMRISFSYSR